MGPIHYTDTFIPKTLKGEPDWGLYCAITGAQARAVIWRLSNRPANRLTGFPGLRGFDTYTR